MFKWDYEVENERLKKLADSQAEMILRLEHGGYKVDAERYRWLKTQRHVTWAPHGQAFAGGASGDKLDAAIDALRGEEEK